MKKGQVVIYTGPNKKYYGERMIFRKKATSVDGFKGCFLLKSEEGGFFIFARNDTFYPVRR